MKTQLLRIGVLASLVAVAVAGVMLQQPVAAFQDQPGPFDKAAVVSVDPIASQVGAEILRKGGNAVDAAIATGMALAVTHPSAGNIGGGGFMVIYLADKGEVATVDYREKAPEKATPTMFLDAKGEVDPAKVNIGPLVIGVPGTVSGFWEASRKYGKLDWKALVEPAVKLAREGFVVDKVLADGLKGQERFFREYTEFGRVYRRPNGSFYEAGDRIVLPDLAWALDQIRQRGADGFYTGEVARRLVEGLQAHGGIITMNDLANYKAALRPAVRGSYRGYEIIGMPPASSGGITITQMLNVLETYDLARMKRRDAQTIHLLTETMKLGFYNRAKYLGDTDFVQVDARSLTSKEFAAELRGKIRLDRAMASKDLGADIITRGESPETTHYSVVDAQGNAVSNTYTLEGGYGSKVMAEGTGFLLNNEMHDFNVSPGVTDLRGLIGTKPNLIEPGKRMLSSMSPTIVLKDGKPYLVTGSPGGRTIINTVLQIIVNVLDFGMDAQAAVDEPRIHHQWLPDVVRLERGLADAQAGLTERGQKVELQGGQGDAHSILIKDGKRYPGVDRRIRGGAAGY